VLEKMTEKGEWVAAATPVATIADDSEVDVVIDAPQQLLSYLRAGRTLSVRAGGQQLQGRFFHFVPRGDVATRTFEVKIRLKNTAGLVEGMEAHALLPNGAPTDGLLLPRDAVMKQRGQDVCFIVVEGKAQMISVTVDGYRGMQVAVSGQGLEAGQQVVIKGNERIRDGQSVRLEE
jgi:RND family efflux transporter MFP subunit